MGYAHIANLYRHPMMLELFRQLIALEKVHGTSAHVSYKAAQGTEPEKIIYFSGGEKYDNFVKLFDEEALLTKFREYGCSEATIYGEAYGGKCQAMSATYGKELKFIAFDVHMSDKWLNIESAQRFVEHMGLEFVPWRIVPATVEAVDAERDRPSEVAERRGCGADKKREGVVLRPVVELQDSQGGRMVAKHKRADFEERRNPPKVGVVREVLAKAEAVAYEWVVLERLRHVLDKLPQGISVESTKTVIEAMIEDVIREAGPEIVDSPQVRRAIGVTTAKMFKEHLAHQLKDKE